MSFNFKCDLCLIIHELQVTFKMQVTFSLLRFDFIYELQNVLLPVIATYLTTLEMPVTLT